jgi:predicted amidophosphoribosyltransferase
MNFWPVSKAEVTISEMKYGELSKAAAKLGISRQALWARQQKEKGNCKLCGRKRGKSTQHCDACRAKLRPKERKEWREKHAGSRRRGPYKTG